MDQQALYVKQRIQNYLARICSLSQASPPPGRNAANGWFRQSMISDPEIIKCGDSPTLPLDGKAQELFGAYTFFYSMVQRAFHDNPNHKSRWHGDIVWPNLQAMAEEISVLAGSILVHIVGDDEVRDRAKQETAQSIGDLISKASNSGLIWGGEHANGHISVYAADAGRWTISELDKSFAKGTPSDVGKIADILRSVCEQIASLSTQGHSPWLRAEWQIRFHAICDAGEAALASYS